MLPVALCEPGWSSLSISERTRFSRALLDARTMRLLLRFSAITVVRNDVSPAACPGAAGASCRAARVGQPLHDRCQVRRQRMAQRDDLDVGGVRNVERGDDAREALQVVGVVGDHQRVVAGIHVDRVVGADQRPQDRHQVAGGFIVQAEDLRHDLVARHRRAHGHGAALQLGIGLGHDFQQPARFDHREAGQAQRRQELVERRRGRNRFLGAQRDRAFHARIDHDVAPADGRHGAGHGLDVGVDEVEGDGLGTALRLRQARQRRDENAGQAEHGQATG